MHTQPFWDAAHPISSKGLMQHLQRQHYPKENSSYFPPHTVKPKSTCLLLTNIISKHLKWWSTSWAWKNSEFSILVLPFVIKPIFGFNFQKHLKLTQFCGNLFCKWNHMYLNSKMQSRSLQITELWLGAKQIKDFKQVIVHLQDHIKTLKIF